MQSFQLSVRGRPSAFDLHSDLDTCIVAAPGCLTFYNLNALGSPRHVIHYEQPQQVRQVSFQKHGYKVAALRGGVVSLWDVSKTLKPLIGIIKDYSSVNSYITDMRWSNENDNVLVTGSDCGGHIGIWDIRTPQTSVQSMLQTQNTSICHGVEWCPSNSYIIASSNRNTIFVWDIRMAADRESAPFLNKGESITELHQEQYGITQFAWTNCDNKNAIVISSSQGLEWWNIDDIDKSFERKYVQSCKDIALILPLPMSNSILTYKQYSNDKVKPICIESSDNDVSSNLIEIYLESKSNLNPDDDTHSYKVAFCHEPILGMKWGRAGHLVPPSHSGLELIFLTASASLYAIRISGDVLKNSGGSFSRQISNTELSGDFKISPTFHLSLLDDVKSSVESEEKKLATLTTIGNNNSSELNSNQPTNNIWTLMRQDILDLEEFLQIGNMAGLRISLIDHLSRRIILDMIHHDEGANVVVSLLITIPTHFPIENPSFQLKSASSSSYLTVSSALIAELNAITKRMQLPLSESPKNIYAGKFSTKDFLFEIANCFRNRLLQNWGEKADPVQVMNVSISTVKQKGETYKFTTDFINPVAYRVPCPRSSGGTFLASGKIVCFGGAFIGLNQDEKNWGNTNFPKTYADYLIAASECNDNENPLYPDNNNPSSFDNKSQLKDDNESVSDDASGTSDMSDDNENFSKSNTPALLRVSSLESTLSSFSNKGWSQKDSQAQNFIPMEDSLQSFGDNIDLMEFKMKRLQGSVRVATTLSQIKIFDTFDDKLKDIALFYSLGSRNQDMYLSQSHTFEYSSHFVSGCASCCRHNSSVAEKMGCSAIVVQLWNLLAVSLDLLSHSETNSEANMINWKESVLGLPLLYRILNHLIELNDVQVLATLICILGGSAKTIDLLKPRKIDSNKFSQSILMNMKRMTKDYFENILLSYVSILAKWGALLQATEVLKQTSLPPSCDDDFHEQTEYMPGLGLLCSRCGVPANEFYGKKQAIWCMDCDTYAVNCAVCNNCVKSDCYFCPSCGHGGHPSHMKEWFQVCPDCPTGCGCRCSELLFDEGALFSSNNNKIHWQISNRYDDDSDENSEESTDTEYENFEDEDEKIEPPF